MTHPTGSSAPTGHEPRSRRADTRGRILEVAVRMFAERGYAATSIRDIAEELGVTKAAVHYHFSAKEQIGHALIEPMLQQLDEVVEHEAQRGAGPRALLLGLRDVLAASGPLLTVLSNDPSLGHPSPELHARVDALVGRTAQVLAGPGGTPDGLLRAHCALGAFLTGWKVCGVPGPAGTATQPGAAELDVVLAAALAALARP